MQQENQVTKFMIKRILFVMVLSLISNGLFSQQEKKPVQKKTTPAGVKNEKRPPAPKAFAATDFYRSGTEKQELNDLVGAIDDFNKALEMDPGFFMAILSRGKVRFVQQDFENAMRDFDQTIVITEKLMEEAKKKGNVKIILGDHKGATKDFFHSDSMKPILAEALFNRGNVRNFLDNKEGCCEDLKKSSELGYLKAYEYLKKYCQ